MHTVHNYCAHYKNFNTYNEYNTYNESYLQQITDRGSR